jgi:hypothetical protein
LCFGFGPVQAQQFSGHLYKEASNLGFREFSCLVENYHVLHCVSSLRGNGAAVLSNKDCCEGSCVHQELSGSGLRHGDLHHVACWICSSSSGDVLHVIGRFLSGRLAVKDQDKTQGSSA